MSAQKPESYYLTLHQIGGACPFQAEGTILGCPFYLRARHGKYTLNVVEPGACPVATWDNPEKIIVHLEGDDHENGYMGFINGISIIGEAFAKTWDAWDMWNNKRREVKP